MYGMVNKAIEDMVRERFGAAAWQAIRTRAGIEVPGFVSMRSYPDELTSALVAAVADELGSDQAAVLRAFGEYWVLETAERGYGPLMALCGSSLPEFLRNLDQMHARVSLTSPQMQLPSFEVTDETAQSLVLHYRSERPGLTEFVVGLVNGLARRLATNAEVRVIARRDAGADHDQFLITMLPHGV